MLSPTLYSATAKLLWENNGAFAKGGSRVKIDHVIFARPVSCPRYFSREEKGRQANALAFGRRHVFYGFWRHVRHRGNHPRRGLWTGHSDPLAPARPLVPPDGLHDQRAVQCPSRGGRLLR